MDRDELLVQRYENEDRIIGERTTALLLGNAFLFIGFVELANVSEARLWFLLLLPSVGLLFTFSALRLNHLSAQTLDSFKRVLGEEPGDEAARIVRDGFPDPSASSPGVMRKLNVYVLQVWGFALLFVVLWLGSMIWAVMEWS